MAKSLQNILNDVVGEILQENEMLKGTSFMDAPNTEVDVSGIKLREPTVATLGRDARNAEIASALSELPQSDAGFQEMLRNRFISGMGDNNPLAYTAGISGSSPIASPEEDGFLDRISNMASNAKDSISDFWDARTTPEKVGIGALMAAPLAAGAGALYLRKRQREANKAAGVR